MNVSIVIVAYDAPAPLRRCLSELGDTRARTVVVDNASPAGEGDLVGAEFPEVRTLRLSDNRGFGAGANAGVAASATPWVLLLNPDAWPLGPGLEELLRFAGERPRLGAAGPVLTSLEGRVQRSTIRPPLAPWSLALWAAAPEAVSRAYGVLRSGRSGRTPGGLRAGEFLQGAALLLRREAFDAVGGFDERFFMYGEDADLCARLRAAGWEVELCPTARFVHLGAASTSGRADAMYRELLRSWLRLIAKRDGLPRADRARRALLVALRVRAAVAPRSAAAPVAGWLAASTASELLGGSG